MNGVHPGLAIERQKVANQTAGVVEVELSGGMRGICASIGQVKIARFEHGR